MTCYVYQWRYTLVPQLFQEVYASETRDIIQRRFPRTIYKQTINERQRERERRMETAGGVVCGQNVAYYLPVLSGWGESIGVQCWKRLESIFIATVQHVRPAGEPLDSASFPCLSKCV